MKPLFTLLSKPKRMLIASVIAFAGLMGVPSQAAYTEASEFSTNELLNAGHSFFGQISGNLAGAIESVVSRFGQPSAYVIGEEAGAALIGGLSYGEGLMYTKTNSGNPLQIYWQGPSLGFDAGANGDRTMVLIYGIDQPDDILRRFGGVSGSAYLVGGLSVRVLASDNIFVVPVQSGVGARLGANIGYLKFTEAPTWNPF